MHIRRSIRPVCRSPTVDWQSQDNRQVPILLATGTAMVAGQFERTAIYLEQNIQDEDAEVKIDVIAGSAGLSALSVVAPDGRTVLDVRTADSKLGMRHYTLESPEPRMTANCRRTSPKAPTASPAPPRTAATLDGEAVAVAQASRCRQRHATPVMARRTFRSLASQVKWDPSKDASALIVAVEHEESGREVTANLPGSARRLHRAGRVPDSTHNI